MTRTYYRKYSTNAAPSESKWQKGQPRVCHICKEKVVLGKGAFFSIFKGHSYHFDCYFGRSA